MRKKRELFKVLSGTAFIYTPAKITGDELLDNKYFHKEHKEYQSKKLLDNRYLHDGHKEYPKSYNLPIILKREFEKSFRGEGGRSQSGYFHVWFRGNNRYNVFYTDDDYIGFLSRCNIASAKHKSKITAFAIMNNHVHLQVYSNNLSLFISSILITFNRWFNKRKGLRGKLFETPFKSYQLLTQDSLKKNMLYIITNPVNAGICNNVYEYKWTSYHFSKEPNLNHLGKIINLDTTIMNDFYSSPKELLSATKKFIAERNNYNAESNDNDSASNITAPKSTSEVTGYSSSSFVGKIKHNDSELANILRNLLNNKELYNLDRADLAKIAKQLKYKYNATYRQIASLTHESYEDIRRMVLSSDG